MTDDPVARIGIAVVEHQGRFLVGTRPEGKPLAGSAEFPGGKCRPGENPDSCAIRECFEETGLEIRAIRLLDHLAWNYSHGPVELNFWLCEIAKPAEPSTPFRWVSRKDLQELRFPEANARVVAALVSAEN